MFFIGSDETIGGTEYKKFTTFVTNTPPDDGHKSKSYRKLTSQRS